MIRRLIKWGGLGILALLVLAQAVPYGRSHSNPPVTKEPAWDSAATRAQVVESCFDCHSNETKWPWYTNVAPSSWLVQRDVDEGRSKLNFSEWDRPQEGSDAAEVVRSGEMPPWQYTLLHRGAKLSDAEKESLAKGLEATFGPRPPGSRGRDE
jgi:mono/diheme cytochrome c family protein